MTSRGLVAIFGLGALAISGLGCKSACDDAALRRAAAAFEDRTFERRKEGFEQLGSACPTMPATLTQSLLAEFDENPPEAWLAFYVSRSEDPVWRELADRTCPGTVPRHASSTEDRPSIIREHCDLDRYGLLAPDELLISRDLVPFMLYEWLVGRHVDQALAREVVWPLLAASNSAAELETMCLQDGIACEPVVAAWGMDLPRSSMDLPVQGGTEVRITAEQLLVDRVPVLPLTAGRPAPGAFVQHVAPALRETLAAHAADRRASASSELGKESATRVTIAVERTIPFDILVDVLFTATKAGFTEAELVVHRGDQLRGLPVTGALAWFQQDPNVRRHRTTEFVLEVHRDSVVVTAGPHSSPTTFPSPAACEPPSTDCHDLEAVGDHAKQIKALFPHETVATLRVDRDVSVQALVSLTDAVRGGDDCRLLRAFQGDEVPDTCLLWQVIVDAEPPLFFHVDRLSTLTLGDARVERRPDYARGGPSRKALLDAFAAAREEIQRCLLEHTELTRDLRDEDQLTILYARDSGEPRRTTARLLHHGFPEVEVERCVLEPLGVALDEGTTMHFLERVQVELVIPTRFELTTND